MDPIIVQWIILGLLIVNLGVTASLWFQVGNFRQEFYDALDEAEAASQEGMTVFMGHDYSGKSGS